MLFIPRITEQTTAIAYNGNFYWSVDYDDVSVPDLNELQQKQGVRVKYSVGRPFKIFIRPKALTNIYAGPTAPDAHMVGRQSWINAANTGVPYYGLKWAWNGTNQANMDVFTRYYIQCKGVQ